MDKGVPGLHLSEQGVSPSETRVRGVSEHPGSLPSGGHLNQPPACSREDGDERVQAPGGGLCRRGRCRALSSLHLGFPGGEGSGPAGRTFRPQCTADSGGYTMKWRRVKPKPSWRLLCSSSVRGPCQGSGRPGEHPSLGPSGSCGSTGRRVSGLKSAPCLPQHRGPDRTRRVHGLQAPFSSQAFLPLSHSSAQPLLPSFFPLNPLVTNTFASKEMTRCSEPGVGSVQLTTCSLSTYCAGRCTRSACCCLSSFLPLHNLTCSHTYAHADMSTWVHAHRTHRDTQTSTLMRGVHTHTHVDSKICAHRHTESVSCTQHMPHMQTNTCTDRLAPTHSLQEQQGEQGGTKSHQGAWLVQWSRVRNRGVGWGETLGCPLAHPLEYLRFPRMTCLETRVWGHTGLFLAGTRGRTVPEGGLPQSPAQTLRGKVSDRRDVFTGRQGAEWRKRKSRAEWP